MESSHLVNVQYACPRKMLWWLEFKPNFVFIGFDRLAYNRVGSHIRAVSSGECIICMCQKDALVVRGWFNIENGPKQGC